MKRLWLRLFLFLPVLFGLTSVNYIADPGDLFGQNGQGRLIAQSLLQGKNVYGAFYCDNGIWHRLYIQGLDQKDVVVLGSSRTVNIHADFFPGHTFVNSSVLAAQLGDMLALYGMFRQMNHIPSRVILEASPWMVDRSANYLRWTTMQPELSTMQTTLGRDLPLPLTARLSLGLPIEYLELFSPSYFQQALPILFQTQRSFRCTTTDQAYGNNEITLPDGSLNWHTDVPGKAIDSDYLLRRAEDYVKENTLPANAQMNQLDELKADTFRAFIELLLRDHVQVVILLVPYQPVTYQGLVSSRQYPVLLQAEAFYRELADHFGLQLIGSYNPADCSLEAESFLDEMHVRVAGLRQIFEQGCRRPTGN